MHGFIGMHMSCLSRLNIVMTWVIILQAGSVMGRVFQPHESHIPYLLQFKVGLQIITWGCTLRSPCLNA